MPDYQKSKIYKISSPSKNLIYYGSTTQSLSQRLSQHIRNKPCMSKLVLDCEDYKIELVEEYPCNNRKQLEKKEGEYIKTNECVNKNINGRTAQEWNYENREKRKAQKKEYNEKNKELIKQQQKEYNEKNADKVKQQRQKYYNDNRDKINEQHRQYYLKQKELKKVKIEIIENV